MSQALARGMPIPEKIRNAPTLLPGLELYYDAFLDLNSCRQLGMGVGPIPWMAVSDYAVAMGLSREQTEDLHHHMRAMDNAYSEYWSKKHEKKRVATKTEDRSARQRVPMGRES